MKKRRKILEKLLNKAIFWESKFVSLFKIAVFCIACVQKCPHFLQVQGKKIVKAKKKMCICQGTV